jgi:hypothetical protein
MAGDFNDLLATMSLERRANIERRVEEIHSSLLYRIRKAFVSIGAAEPQRKTLPPRGSA